MTRISISNAALEGIFHERMKAFVECPPEMKIAVASVESKRWGWMAITKPSDRIAHPDCAKRVAEIEAELRVMFESRRRLKFWPSRRLSTKRCAGADHFDAIDRPASHFVIKYADN